MFHLLYGEAGFACAARWARRTGHACVATFHAPPSLMTGILRRPRDLRLLDGVVLVGSSQVPYFEAYVRDRDAISVIPHGVDTEYFTPIARRATETFTCLSVGAFLRDYDLVARVADALAGDARMHFVIVAPSETTRHLSDRSNVTCLSGLSDDDLLACYRAADVFVLTAHDMTANNALLEAMACGVPVIGEDVGSVRDYVRTDHAVLCHRSDAESVVRAICALASQREARNCMAAAARAHAMELSWPRIARRVLEMYEHVKRRVAAAQRRSGRMSGENRNRPRVVKGLEAIAQVSTNECVRGA
jgi:glycosyltransferase involved in cell wall biosynthesis